MKKFGFTLAEVLVTLGLVGVIAAITLPTLMNDTTSAQIGPKLAKAVATFEQANRSLLVEKEVDSISEGDLISRQDEYISSLSKYMNISPFEYTVEPKNVTLGGMVTFDDRYPFISKDGIVYLISKGYDDTHMPDLNKPPQERIAGALYIDINGLAKPNSGGTDIFAFTLWDNGSLRPAGGHRWNGNDSDTTWETTCPINSIPTSPLSCTGHIFENNLKVLYK